jgi:hypothetical protein
MRSDGYNELVSGLKRIPGLFLFLVSFRVHHIFRAFWGPPPPGLNGFLIFLRR